MFDEFLREEMSSKLMILHHAKGLRGLGYKLQLAQEFEQCARNQFTGEMGLEERLRVTLSLRAQQL